MNEEVCDVVFIVDGQRIPALKTVLSLKSEVFRDIFSNEFNDKEVVIKDTTYEAFKVLIRFLICHQLVLKGDKDLQLIEDVCKLSQTYKIARLMDEIGKHLKKIRLTLDMIEWFARIAFRYQIEDLIATVMAFIDKNINEFVKKDINQLKDLYESTDGRLLKVMAERLCPSPEAKPYEFARSYCCNCNHINAYCNGCGQLL